MQLPVDSELLYRLAHGQDEIASVRIRVLVMDPQFLDEGGKPLPYDVPADYVEALLNDINPQALYSVNVKHFEENLKHLGPLAEETAARGPGG